MAGKHNVGVTISAKDLASGVIQKVSARTVALGVAVGNLASKLISGAVNGVRRWIDEALEAERANVMLDAALRGTGQYTDEVARKMKDLAGAIQDETGASDEAVKANIAMLTTMGVTTDKMGEAARAVQALSALNFEGSQAAKAVALAMEGNMSGFQRMIPALRNATTETEKVEAVNKVLAAGYAQQKANLNTVGGAWEALKGRIGDAREDIVGAIFEGLALGKTFDGMQAAVGRFLKSDTFKDFTESLKSGASYVKQIIEAMGTDGGTKEVFAAMGNVILAALKDGADYVGAKISEAFGKFDYVGRAARFWGAKSAGASTEEALGARDNALLGGKGGGNLSAALAKLNEVTQRRSKIAQEYEQLHDRAEDENDIARKGVKSEEKRLDAGKRAFLDAKAAAKMDAKILEAKEKQSKLEGDRNRIADDIKSTEESIRDAADREQAAREEIADAAEERAGLMRQSISEWIGNQQGDMRSQEDIEKQNRRDQKKAARLRKKQDVGTHLSKRDTEWLDLFDRRDMLLRDPANIGNAAAMAGQAQEDQGELNKRLEKLQQDQTDILSRIEEFLKASLEVD
jgi:hypothetical protein